MVWPDEGRPPEPPHVHVFSGRSRRGGAKVWLAPVEFAHPGRFSAAHLTRIMDIVRELHSELRRTYRDLHGR